MDRTDTDAPSVLEVLRVLLSVAPVSRTIVKSLNFDQPVRVTSASNVHRGSSLCCSAIDAESGILMSALTSPSGIAAKIGAGSPAVSVKATVPFKWYLIEDRYDTPSLVSGAS